MNRPSRPTRGTVVPAAALAAAVALTGCLDYTFETTVAPDGSGVRVERLEVTGTPEATLSEDDVRTLTLTGSRRGWTRSVDVDEEGDTTWILERRSAVDDLTGWSDPPRRTILLGTTPARADTRLGYVRLGDVAFRSSVQVGVSRQSDGTSVVRYREAFAWDQAADALVEFLVTSLDGKLRERYPRLTEADRAAIVGYARARIWIAGEEGLFSGEDEDEAIARAAERTAEHGVKIVRLRHPEADAGFLRQAVTEVMAVDDSGLARLFEELLPGLNLGFNSSIVYRLTLPGRVTTTNAHDRAGNTLEWKFSPLDDPQRPVEIFAESVVGPGPP